MARIQSWLDYAVELGASGAALGPVFASETQAGLGPYGWAILDV